MESTPHETSKKVLVSTDTLFFSKDCGLKKRLRLTTNYTTCIRKSSKK